MESLRFFLMWAVQFVGLNPTGFFSKDLFTLYFAGIFHPLKFPEKNHLVFPMVQSNNFHANTTF